MKYRTIIVWFNRNKKKYYFKKYRVFIENKYEVGYVNQYNHEIILIIDIRDFYYKTPLKKRLIKRFIRFLEKIE